MSNFQFPIKKIILFFLPFIFLLILLARPDQSFTQDLGRHIKTGEIILKCMCVPSTNLFSYTETTHQFINHHWFSEVIFSLLYHTLGENSLMFLKAILLAGSFGIVYWYGFKKNAFWAWCLACPYLFIFSERFDTRPELFSFLFISLFLFLLLKYRDTKNLRFLLPLIFIEFLWVNMHIYFVMGLLLLGILLIEEVITRQKSLRQTGLIFLLVLGVTFLNPNGLKGAFEPFFILTRYGYSIVENQNIIFLNSFFFNPRVLLFEVLSLAVFIVVLIERKKMGIFPVMVYLFATLASYYMIRNLPLFVLLTFPFSVTAVAGLEKNVDRIHQNVIRGCAGVMSMGIVVWVSISILTSQFLGFSYIHTDDRALTFFQENHIKGPVFNNFDIGSYLIYKLYPQEKVFVDGRPEAYSVEFFNAYKKAQKNPILFDQLQKKYTINTIFFAHTDITPWAQQFIGFITKDPRWVPVYLDERIIILVKNNPQNKEIIARWKKTL